MSDTAEPTFVAAAPGWDVLTRTPDGYESTPVVAWACLRSEEFVRAFPVTAAVAWSLNDDRVVSAPDGRVIDGDAEWSTIAEWLADKHNPRWAILGGTGEAGRKLRAGGTPDVEHRKGVLALDTFRDKFRGG